MNIILGNGESRKNLNLNLLLDHTTYGCNAIHRDWNPTHLVCIDNKMLHEIVESQYCKMYHCWFRNFQLMDAEMYPVLRSTVTPGIDGLNQHTHPCESYLGRVCLIIQSEK